MANAIDDALNRATTEQREAAMQQIEEARSKIHAAQMSPGDMSSNTAGTIAYNAQIIEDTKRTMPAEAPLLQHVSEVSSPLPTPSTHGYVNAEPVTLQPETQATIESIQQGDGNNYLNQNAVNRAFERQGNSQSIEQGRDSNLEQQR